MKLDLKTVSIGVGLLLTIVGTTYKSYTWLNTSFASNKRVEAVVIETDAKITKVSTEVEVLRIQRTLEQLWNEYYFLEGQLRKNPQSDTIKRKMDSLNRRIGTLERRLESLQNL